MPRILFNDKPNYREYLKGDKMNDNQRDWLGVMFIVGVFLLLLSGNLTHAIYAYLATDGVKMDKPCRRLYDCAGKTDGLYDSVSRKLSQ
jgi:hypothetical protein